MFQLKNYQNNVLNTLTAYFKEARLFGAKEAYFKVREPQTTVYNAINNLENIPYVCLRLPTGGGKTFLSAHSIKIAAQNYLEKEYPTVIWFTPTSAIKNQTLETLKNPSHPNRQVLDGTFGGNVAIFDIDDFATVRPHDIKNKVCVFVSTIQSFNVNDTSKRNIYAHNENLEPFFTAIPQTFDGLERIEAGADGAGKIKNSFANLLYINEPIMIVDEAHKAVTGLNREVMQRLNPACIIEFTATPNERESNVLKRVVATELKAEEMIKLPIILTEHQTWEQALTASVMMRSKLAKTAAEDKDYIRPIVLIQSESKGEEVTEDVVKQYLIDNENIPAQNIAIVTGEQRELDGINVLDRNCKIEYVITKQALREGWDCPFAYIFCSVANVNSATSVEQFLGRVLRMPYAARRTKEELNKAYAFVSRSGWANAVVKLKDTLVSMGFEEEALQPAMQGDFGFDTAPRDYHFKTDKLDINKFTKEEQTILSAEKLPDGAVEIKVNKQTPNALLDKVLAELPKKEKEAFFATASFVKNREISFCDSGEKFAVPELCLFGDEEWHKLNDKELFLPEGWRLLDYPAVLTEAEFNIRQEGTSFEIDINGNKVTERYLQTSLIAGLDDSESAWTNLELSRWLDREVRQPDITQPVKLEFMRRFVDHLTINRGLHLSALVRTKFLLARAIGEKINNYRRDAYAKGFQQVLFADSAQIETKMDFSFEFTPNYPIRTRYSGSKRFNKHFYGNNMVGEMNGEEAECAMALDMLPEVKYWVRNIETQPQSFSLPTSTDRFYPDFIALLNDGRIMAVEYKGEQLLTSEDTKEKKNIGELWAAKSGGKCLFALVSKGISDDLPAQLKQIIG